MIELGVFSLLSGAADASVSVFDIDPVPFDQTQKYIAKPLFTARRVLCSTHIKCLRAGLLVRREDTHKDLISCVQWYKDTGMFFTGSFDKTVAVWDTNFAEVSSSDLENTEVLSHVAQVALRVKLSGKVYCMSYCYASEQSAVAAIGTSESPLRLWDIRTAVCSHSLLGTYISSIFYIGRISLSLCVCVCVVF
jgi:DNA excision repair protein ERCC-8